MTDRHPSVQQVADWLDPNPNLPAPQRHVAEQCAALRDHMLADLADGPELTTGLRKLLEAKDCFVRQSLTDVRKVVDGSN